MKENALWGDSKTQLGLGVLHWELHLKAIRIHWLAQRYMDGKRGPWKTLISVGSDVSPSQPHVDSQAPFDGR